MIVIALSALAYTWFSGIFASMTQSAGTAVTSTTQAMSTQFRIESAKFIATGCNGRYTTPFNGCLNITIRNTGTQSFNADKTSVYVGGAYSPILGASAAGTLIQYGTAVIYNVSNQTTACPTTGVAVVTVTIETGLSDSRPIAC